MSYLIDYNVVIVIFFGKSHPYELYLNIKCAFISKVEVKIDYTLYKMEILKVQVHQHCTTLEYLCLFTYQYCWSAQHACMCVPVQTEPALPVKTWPRAPLVVKNGVPLNGKIFLLINIFTFYTKRIVTNSKCRIGQLHQTTTAHFFGVFQHSNYTPIDQNRKQFSVKKVLINPVFVNRPAPQDWHKKLMTSWWSKWNN